MASLKIQAYERNGHKWNMYECSECHTNLDKTAKFCIKCGAWFTKPKKKVVK